MVQHAPTGGADPEPGNADTAREPFLRRVLERFEAGDIEPYDYTRRVMAINAAESTAHMAAIADALPAAPGDGTAEPSAPVLDAVDLALMHRRQQQAGPSEAPRTRYVTLAVVLVFFAVLIGVGVWVASRAHALGPPPGGTIVGVLAVALPG